MDGFSWIPIGYSLAAGALAAFNPCSFAILPGFVAHYIGTIDTAVSETGWKATGGRGVILGLAATAALVILFSAVGLAFVLAGQSIIGLFPWNELAIGVVLLLLAVQLLRKGKLPGMPGAHRVQESLSVNPRSAFWFGFTYGIGSLGCTLAPFLIVAASAVVTPGLLPAFSQFIGFAVGMGGVVIGVSVGVSFFRGAAVRRMRNLLPRAAELGAYLMLGAGAYLIIQWLRATFI